MKLGVKVPWDTRALCGYTKMAFLFLFPIVHHGYFDHSLSDDEDYEQSEIRKHR